MRGNMFRNKWLGLLLLALALAGVTRLVGSARPAAEVPATPTPAAPPSQPAATPSAPAPQPTETVDASDDDLIDSGLGTDTTGFDPSPATEAAPAKKDETGDGAMKIVPDDPVGEDPSPAAD